MRALRFHKQGTLSDARVEDVPKPMPGSGEILIRVRAAAINPSDVENVLGGFLQTTLPRTPGGDFAGVVEVGQLSTRPRSRLALAEDGRPFAEGIPNSPALGPAGQRHRSSGRDQPGGLPGRNGVSSS